MVVVVLVAADVAEVEEPARPAIAVEVATVVVAVVVVPSAGPPAQAGPSPCVMQAAKAAMAMAVPLTRRAL